MGKCKLVIELGSSNTVIYKVGYGIVLKEPTVIAVKNDKYETCEVGFNAKKLIGKTDDSLQVVFPVENGIIKYQKYAEKMLKKFISKISENKNQKFDAIFCVSTGLSDNQLLIFKEVAYACGISKVKFVNTCLAGLIGAGVIVDKYSAVGCVNLGGSTSNFAVISRGKVIEGFSVSFGGIDMDNSIIEYIKSLKNIEISSSVAEKLKNECGSLYLQDTTNMEVLGVDLDTKRPVNEIITASEVRDAIIQYFENIKTGIEHLLYSCTADIISDVSLNGVYVVGGIANFVGLENYLSKKLNLHIIIPDEPENCTVLGANSCDEYY